MPFHYEGVRLVKDGGSTPNDGPGTLSASSGNFGDNWNNFWSGFGDWLYRVSGTKAQNDYNERMYQQQVADNDRLARDQRKWEERMANTTYQRSVADMQAAGINPAILSGLTSGSAVSTGSGSAASASSSSSSSGTSSGIIGALALVIASLVRGKPKAK